eukprot:scaffold86914_cov33-Phaeocystis_antarctica.AAC.1
MHPDPSRRGCEVAEDEVREDEDEVEVGEEVGLAVLDDGDLDGGDADDSPAGALQPVPPAPPPTRAASCASGTGGTSSTSGLVEAAMARVAATAAAAEALQAGTAGSDTDEMEMEMGPEMEMALGPPTQGSAAEAPAAEPTGAPAGAPAGAPVAAAAAQSGLKRRKRASSGATSKAGLLRSNTSALILAPLSHHVVG